MQPFHIAIPVRDLESTREFYVETLGCRVGRESDAWIDFDLFGHQVSAHVRPAHAESIAFANPVDGDQVPIPHFGVVLAWDDWHALAERLRERSVEFRIEPHVRFAGEVGEQATMFFLDASGNALEFKSFKDEARLFAS